ncbi:MAG: aldehyde ferredoxin oxidoreductase family protein [Anaerolineales bacterium]|nr:aldehyde ferredoxin oxidoreductase family protein [Anaerolineales bacterium]
MTGLGGYVGRFLYVELADQSWRDEVPSETLLREFIGGYGIGARVLYDMIPAGADPLGPDNVLGFVTGPLTGSPAMIASRYCAVAKSPLTGGWGDANSGGDFGPALKFAGYDAVFISGMADSPVYLLIDNGKVEIRAADDLWGLDTKETEDILQERHGKDSRVACIGPAGEKLSLISCIINDQGRAAGRSGLGAVMGSKKLKAIVARGNQKPEIADEDQVKALRKQYLADFKKNETVDLMRNHGTSGFMKTLVEIGRSPIKNWSGGYPDNFPTVERLDGPAITPYERKKYACWRCPQACGAILEGEFDSEAIETHRPEYETLALIGSNCQIDDIEAVMMLNEMCNRAGLDTISSGAVIAFAMECYDKGILTTEQLGGMSLEWGDGRAAVKLLQMIIDREGIGDLLAQGVMRASRQLGQESEAFAIHSGGQELPAHDPRHEKYFGLAYKMSPTPGRHTQGGVDAAGISAEDKAKYGVIRDPENHDPEAFDAETYAAVASHLNVLNAAGLCTFGGMFMDPSHVYKFIANVTGWDFDLAECIETGQRIEVMRHLFGLREGYNPLEAGVTPRALGYPPLTAGETAGVSVDVPAMLEPYLKVMDWDSKTAVPSKERLERLNLLLN